MADSESAKHAFKSYILSTENSLYLLLSKTLIWLLIIIEFKCEIYNINI